MSWLLVSVEMAPSEMLLEDTFYLSGTAKTYGSQAMTTSGPVQRSTPLPSPPLPKTHTHTHSRSALATQLHHHQYQHSHTHTHRSTHTIIRTCWPVVLRRREMLSNSAFQHSTSDYLFSFTGRFQLVMYFPLGVGLASLFLVPSLPGVRDPLGQ